VSKAKSYKSKDKLTFGKYKGSTIDWVAQSDPSYINWMYNNGLCDKKTLDRRDRGVYKCRKLKPGYAVVWSGGKVIYDSTLR
jgi:hypothetical protein